MKIFANTLQSSSSSQIISFYSEIKGESERITSLMETYKQMLNKEIFVDSEYWKSRVQEVEKSLKREIFSYSNRKILFDLILQNVIFLN